MLLWALLCVGLLLCVWVSSRSSRNACQGAGNLAISLEFFRFLFGATPSALRWQCRSGGNGYGLGVECTLAILIQVWRITSVCCFTSALRAAHAMGTFFQSFVIRMQLHVVLIWSSLATWPNAGLRRMSC